MKTNRKFIWVGLVIAFLIGLTLPIHKVFAQLSNGVTTNLGLSNGFEAGAMTQNALLNTNFNTLDAMFNSSKSLTVASGGTGSTGVNNCGSSASCASPAAVTTPLLIQKGTAAMSSGTSVAITGMTAYTSATSYACMATNADGHAYTGGTEAISATAFTIVSGTSNSDTWQWVCIGQ